MGTKLFKVIVLRSFYDLAEKVNRKKGEAFVITDARLREINSKGHGKLVEAIEEVETKLTLAKVKKVNLKELKNDELKAKLDGMGIEYKAKATKDELIALIEEGD